MAATTGTCPRCHAKTDDRHCNKADHPGAKCPWWRCVLCKIDFRPSDGRILPPSPSAR